MYKHFVEGTYVTAGKLKEVKAFEAEFDLEEGKTSLARAIIQNGLIKDWARKNLDNFATIRTCQIVDSQEVDGQADNPELEQLLKDATELGCMPINYSSYRTDVTRKKELKTAITKKRKKIAEFELKQGKKPEAGVEDYV